MGNYLTTYNKYEELAWVQKPPQYSINAFQTIAFGYFGFDATRAGAIIYVFSFFSGLPFFFLYKIHLKQH